MTHWKDLFGGAIVAQLPEELIDASEIRQVPDNQEVFLYPNSNVSIIIEVLERIAEQIDVEAVKFHFEALAHDNEAVKSTMQAPYIVHNDRGDQTPSPIVLRGLQRIHKFNTLIADDVDILFALFRVCSRGKSADMVVSVSIPRNPREGCVEHEHVSTTAESDFNVLVSSLRIVDYDLFR